MGDIYIACGDYSSILLASQYCLHIYTFTLFSHFNDCAILSFLIKPPGTMSVEIFDPIEVDDGAVYTCSLTSDSDDVGRCIAVTGGALNVTVYSE